MCRNYKQRIHTMKKLIISVILIFSIHQSHYAFANRLGKNIDLKSIIVNNIVDIENLDTNNLTSNLIYLVERGGGFFYWDKSDLSEKVAIDIGQGIYIAPASEPTGKSGAWVRKYSGDIYVKWFGANGLDNLEDTNALKSATRLANNGNIRLEEGNFIITDTIQIKDFGSKLIGAGQQKTIITMNDDHKFAIDLFSLSSTTAEIGVKHLTIKAKYGIKTRFNINDNFKTQANPTKHHIVEDVKFIGKYDIKLNQLPEEKSIPKWIELAKEGIAIHSVMSYRMVVTGCEISNYGIGFSSIGNTLAKFSHNRLFKNARNIHDERIKWYRSAFGMGADNTYKNNDILDSSRIGSVTFINSFGINFSENYLENLNRHGYISSSTLLYLKNTSNCLFYNNHFNPYLSIHKNKPFIFIEQDDSYIGEASNNRIFTNRLTPQKNLQDSKFLVKINKINMQYPSSFFIYSNNNFPIIDAPYIINKESTDLSKLSYNNISEKMNLSGSIIKDRSIFLKDKKRNLWYLKNFTEKKSTASLDFNLYLENKSLENEYELIIEATGDGKKQGLLSIVLSDEGNNITTVDQKIPSGKLKRITVPIKSLPKATKKFSISLKNLDCCRVYSCYIHPKN